MTLSNTLVAIQWIDGTLWDVYKLKGLYTCVRFQWYIELTAKASSFLRNHEGIQQFLRENIRLS